MEVVGITPYIDKLGHSLEEIRVRALNHIIFKLNNRLISYNELALNSQFLKQLIRWFDFEPITEQGKIITLLLKLLKSNNDARCFWQHIGISYRLQEIKDKLSAKYSKDLDEIFNILMDYGDEDLNTAQEIFTHAIDHEISDETVSSPVSAIFIRKGDKSELEESRLPRLNKGYCDKNVSSNIPWYPHQPLSPRDFNILSSVEHSLSSGLDKRMKGLRRFSSQESGKDLDEEEDTLISCCQFVYDVILHDFLPEVFLQQPGIASTLLCLLPTLGNELEPGFHDTSTDEKTSECLYWVIKCLDRIAVALYKQLLFYEDPSIPNLKNNNVLNSVCSPTFGSSLTNDTDEMDSRPIGQLEGRMKFDHFQSVHGGKNSHDNQAPLTERPDQFYLPHFCVSILFQTISLSSIHSSGSNSKIFQSIISLSSASIRLLSRIFDSSMWVSQCSDSVAVTDSIREVFRMVGQCLLLYQSDLYHKKNNVPSDSSKLNNNKELSGSLNDKMSKSVNEVDFDSLRLAYLQILYLTHSLLNLAPKEPIVCRTLVPKELFQALVNAIFDPSFHLFFPNLHRTMLEFISNVSPEVTQVFQETLKVSKSVKTGIEILRGTKKSYGDVSEALVGLAFHGSLDITRKCIECVISAYRNVMVRSEIISAGHKVSSRGPIIKNQSKIRSAKAGNVENEPNRKSTPELNLEDEKESVEDMANLVAVFLRLMAHESCIVRKEIYLIFWRMVNDNLGCASAKDGKKFRNVQSKEQELKYLYFIWNKSVFMEIIVHGVTSKDSEIQRFAKEMIMLILKSKILVSKEMWANIMEAVLPSLPLMLCYADSETPFGKVVTKFIDPDLTQLHGLDAFEVFKGNCRLLFKSEEVVRCEAATRLAWMLSQESEIKSSGENDVIISNWKDFEKRLPDRETLASFGHSALANAFIFTSKEIRLSTRAHLYPSAATNQVETIDQLLNLIQNKSDNNVSLSDVRVCRSALNQLSLMLESNQQLQSHFMVNNGLSIILKIFQGALVEDDHEHYPECAIPIVNMLKSIAACNITARNELSKQEVVYHCIVRATILFYSEKAFRQDAAQLLCLLLYDEFIIPIDPTSGNTISLPRIVSQSMCIPFQCSTHWHSSQHLVRSPLNSSLMSERESLSPDCFSILRNREKLRENLPWQGLIRLYGSWDWCGKDVLLPSTATRKKFTSFDEKEEKCAIPALLSMSCSEDREMKSSDITSTCLYLLFKIQNATTHCCVEKTLQSLKGCISFWKTRMTENGGVETPGPDFGLLPWHATLGRFLSRSPATDQDSKLLVQVCAFLLDAAEGQVGDKILVTESIGENDEQWLEKLLQNPATLQPLLCPYNPPPAFLEDPTCFTQEVFDGCPSKRGVCREVLSLICGLAKRKKAVSGNDDLGWAYAIYFIAQSLHFGDAEHFYDLAFLEWALSCLVQLTWTSGWGHGVNKIISTLNKNNASHSPVILWEDLISGLVELLSAFHHGGQPLPTWASEEGKPELTQKQTRNVSSSKSSRPSGEGDNFISEEDWEVAGSFMGLSITRSVLLCLNNVLSEMKNTCAWSSECNWQNIWPEVLMNASQCREQKPMRCDSLSGWFLPLWSSRDTLIRSASLKLAAGLATLSFPAYFSKSNRNDGENRSSPLPGDVRPSEGAVWRAALCLFFDHRESNLVREQAVNLLANLVAVPEKTSGLNIDILLQEKSLFKEIALIVSQLRTTGSLLQPGVYKVNKGLMWSTPGLLQAVCKLLRNVMTLRPSLVCSSLWQDNGFLFHRFFGCLERIPKHKRKDTVESVLYEEVYELYSEILSLLTSAIVWDSRLVVLLPQPHPLASVFFLLENNGYEQIDSELERLMIKVRKKAFYFIASSLKSLQEEQKAKGTYHLNTPDYASVAPEGCYSVFLKIAYDALQGSDLCLKKAALISLKSIFTFECYLYRCQMSKKGEAGESSPLMRMLKGFCPEHANYFGNIVALRRLFEDQNEAENVEMKSVNAVKLCHILLHLYQNESSGVGREVSQALSSILLLSASANICAIASGLMETLVNKGKHLLTSIVMGEVEDVETMQFKHPAIAQIKKQQEKFWMDDMSLLLRLLKKFLMFSIEESLLSDIPRNTLTNIVKLEAVKFGLTDLLRKLCTSSLASSLLVDLLSLLTTFTEDCPSACKTLVYSYKGVSISPHPNFVSSSLLHVLCDLTSKEMDSLLSLCATNQKKPGLLESVLHNLIMILETLKNACEVQECRVIIAKSSIFQSFFKLNSKEKKTNSQLVEKIEVAWLSFFLHFTAYNEGQLSLPKIPDMLELLICYARRQKTFRKDTFLSVLRNLAFHPKNRSRLLASDDFLQLLIQVLNSVEGNIWQKEVAGCVVWVLCANSHKSKQILKGVGLENALKSGISSLSIIDNCISYQLATDVKEVKRTNSEEGRIQNVLCCALSVLLSEGGKKQNL